VTQVAQQKFSSILFCQAVPQPPKEVSFSKRYSCSGSWRTWGWAAWAT